MAETVATRKAIRKRSTTNTRVMMLTERVKNEWRFLACNDEERELKN